MFAYFYVLLKCVCIVYTTFVFILLKFSISGSYPTLYWLL